MSRVLITFGDSWPGNAENGQAPGYGQILADTYGFDKFYNYGTGGASNEFSRADSIIEALGNQLAILDEAQENGARSAAMLAAQLRAGSKATD